MSLTWKVYRPLMAMLFLCPLAFWSVLIVYFYKFAPGHWFELSDDPEVWGLFGDFIGGC